MSYKLTLVGFAVGNAVLCFLLERFVSQSQGVKKASHAVLGKKDPRNRFRTIMRDINNLEDWPPKTSENLQQVSLSINRMGGESLKNGTCSKVGFKRPLVCGTPSARSTYARDARFSIECI